MFSVQTAARFEIAIEAIPMMFLILFLISAAMESGRCADSIAIASAPSSAQACFPGSGLLNHITCRRGTGFGDSSEAVADVSFA